jgi:hypothetical protein
MLALRSWVVLLGWAGLRLDAGPQVRMMGASPVEGRGGRGVVGKRLVLCCDGTWNRPDQARDGRPCPTNVTKVAMAVARDGDGIEQRVFYQPGVGTAARERLRGGAFGWGLSKGVQDVYRFVVDNYEPGDELFFFGFSRGAYMARSTAGLIRNAGILRRENADRITQAYALYRDRAAKPRDTESQLFRRSFSHGEATIQFLGVWDTVGALGIPLAANPLTAVFNRRWRFHDVELSRSVQAAYQALAIDEVRRPYEPAVWEQDPDADGQVLEQVWFAGAHSDVGGGYADTSLSDVTLGWMAERARSCGLVFDDGAFVWPQDGTQPTEADGGFVPDPRGQLHDSYTGAARLMGRALRTLGSQPSGHETLSSTARVRSQQDTTYRPDNLDTFTAASPDRVVQVGPWETPSATGATSPQTRNTR